MSEQSPGRKAIAYAENELAVHSVYDEAVLARDALPVQKARLLDLKQKKRQAEERLEDARMEIISTERANHPDESQAAFDRRIKVVLHTDGNVRTLQWGVSNLADEIDAVEVEISSLDKDIQVAVARMVELGGYFNYLAAVKQASAALTKPQETGNPWQ